MIPRERLRMTGEELDGFLAEQRTLRIATVDDSGVPHVVPLWFVWHDGAIWLSSLRRSRRHRHLHTGRPVGLVVDDGATYSQLRGVRLTGRPVIVGPDHPASAAVAAAFSDKYFDGKQMPGRHAYELVRIDADELASWDFRKIPPGADPKIGLDGG